ncbi:hypothetical protein EVAR_39449_1 [Eumeta japonica]|uniref:Uncharacterized protein n=1 Tax=Eumeta variegata TaxID=151549 RepID=A0A4C1W019_EUMVA|nr:hypothetical protein EVAR_39449_1 [Eumeta japonica]
MGVERIDSNQNIKQRVKEPENMFPNLNSHKKNLFLCSHQKDYHTIYIRMFSLRTKVGKPEGIKNLLATARAGGGARQPIQKQHYVLGLCGAGAGGVWRLTISFGGSRPLGLL